jgi:predicted nucleic acid-binding protein
LRIFPDTNVLFSAFASRGLGADLFEVIVLEHALITGKAVLAELRQSLQQEIRLPARRCEEIVEFLRGAAATCVQSSSPISAAVDADDAVILGEAVSGRSEIFVTGDAGVQRLAELDQMKILSPRNLWDYLHSGT